ncbi:MAG: NAD+ synthase [Desulfobacterales bacterium]
MKLSIAQINPIIGDFSYNANKIVHLAHEARERGSDLVVFSELCLSGYPPKDFLEKPDFVAAYQESLDSLANRIQGIGAVVGYAAPNPKQGGNPLFNAAALLAGGKIRHTVCKQLLPTYDVFDELRYFQAGTPTAPLDYQGVKIALTICEDLWNDAELVPNPRYGHDPVAHLMGQGAQMLINISASIYHEGKQVQREAILKTLARKYRVPVIYANQVGGNDGALTDGHSTMWDAKGRMVSRARDFEEDLITYDFGARGGGPADIHPVADSPAASIYKALIMGTRDYVTKCGFRRALIGLSGGIDSALTACVAVEALGAENVTTVFMPSPYTAGDNFEDTAALARNLGVGYETIPIDPSYQRLRAAVCPGTDNAEVGITEQNLQARIRGTILMGLSNKRGALVLSTGNKSELAVGYCTLYGDMNGGLAVISDVPKTMVYTICRMINENREIIPTRIITKAPSAELKPDQTDQDELPPYEVLDQILKGYVEEFKSKSELVAQGFAREVVEDVIHRIHRNEYKRQQAAPGLKVTSKAFGYGRRYPVAQGYA